MIPAIVGNVLSAAVLLTVWMVGRGDRMRRASYFVGAANQIAWVWYCVWLVPQPQILLLEAGLFAVYVWNIVKGK